MTTGEMLRRARENRKISRQAMVLRLELEYGYDMTVPRLRRIENNSTRKRLDDICYLCQVLGISLTDLKDCEDFMHTRDGG